MIRTTRSSFYSVISRSTTGLSAQLRKVEEQSVTGLSINRPSDAPDRLAEVHRLRAAGQDQAVWGKNAASAVGLLDAMDSALGSATDLLASVREIAVATASETYSADDRANQATAVDALKEALVGTANSDFGGRYLFGGTAYSSAPFDDTGAYSGSTEVPSTQVGSTTWVDNGAVGSEVFTDSTFRALDDLSTALTNNDTDGITAALTALDSALDSVSDARVRLGASFTTAEDAEDVSASLTDLLNTRQSDLAGADPVETYMKLSELQTAYDTTLQVAASAHAKTLFDFL